MSHASGRVVEARGQKAVVEFVRSEACAKCRACTAHETHMRVTLENGIGARIGDWVDVRMDPGEVTRASAVGYLIPLAGLAGGIAIGVAVGGEAGGAVGGFAGLAACGLFLWKGVEPWLKRRNAFAPRMERAYTERNPGDREG